MSHNVELVLPDPHPAAEGHFPGNPVIPGAVLLREVLAAVAGGRECREIRAAKFLRPVRPGERIAIAWQEAGDELRFTCSSGAPPSPALTGTLRLGSR